MSIIAEALKKAQRKGRQKVEEPPPFDLKKEQAAKAPPQAEQRAPARPPAKMAPAPRAKPVSKPGQAPRARPVAAAKPAAAAARPVPGPKPKAAKPGRRRLRLAVMAAVIVAFFAGAYSYVKFFYLPSMQTGSIQVVSARKSPPAAREVSEPAGTGEQAAEPAEEPSGTETEIAQVSAAAAETAPAAEPAREPEAEKAAEPGQAVQEPGSGVPAETPAESRVTQDTRPPSAQVPEEQPAVEIARGEPLEEILEQQPSSLSRKTEITPGASQTPAFGPQESLEDLGAGFESPPVIVQKDRGAEKSLREDIYHFNMAVFYQRQKDIPSALNEYNQVLELSPYNAEVYSNMGVLYNQIGEFEKAVAMLQKALLIDPMYSKAHNNIALAYYRSGQLDQALVHLNRAIELEPVNLESYNNLGLVYKKMDDYRKAEEAFARALAIDPAHAASNYNMALLCEENGESDRAVEHYRAFVRSKGVTPELARKVNQRLARITRTAPAR